MFDTELQYRATGGESYEDQLFSYDAQLNAISDAHPGFKGLVGSSDGTGVLIIMGKSTFTNEASTPNKDEQSDIIVEVSRLLDIDQSSLSIASTDRLLSFGDSSSGSSESEIPDFNVLYTLKSKIRPALFNSGYVTSLDIDESIGSITIGVKSSRFLNEAITLVSESERRFVNVIVDTPVSLGIMDGVQANNSSSGSLPILSLRSGTFRPLLPGSHVKFYLGNNIKSCTQGPSVRRADGAYGFLVNSHCTTEFYRMEGIPFYQPTAGASPIGLETEEQKRQSCIGCPKGFYADVAFVRSTNGIQLKGNVAAAEGCENRDSDCLGNSSGHDVSSSSTYLSLDTIVSKVGRSTGNTTGRIYRTCKDHVVQLAGYTEDSQRDVQLLCQNTVRYSSDTYSHLPLFENGDSGSPVYTFGFPLQTVSIAGIAWGFSGLNDFIYSPWENIIDGARADGRGIPVNVIRSTDGLVSN